MKIFRIAGTWEDDERWTEEGDHDYDPNWDYEEDLKPDREIVRVCNRAVKDIKRDILPQLKMFRNFSVYFSTGNERNDIATYVLGTYTRPTIILYAKRIRKLYKEISDQVSLYKIIRSSILHELYHAVQEAEDREMDEDEAEDAGMEFYPQMWER